MWTRHREKPQVFSDMALVCMVFENQCVSTDCWADGSHLLWKLVTEPGAMFLAAA